MLTIPDNLPAVPDAPLPVVYEAARTSLAECEKIDECKDWADKAAALASYARQAQDDALRRMAERIQVRAIRRCGELLKAIESQQGKRNQHTVLHPGGEVKQSRSEAADRAGLSKRQKETALQVAAVPEDDFEEIVESDTPATVTEIAVLGTQKKTVVIDHLQGRDPAEFQMAMYVGGDLRRMRETSEKTDPAAFARGIDDDRVHQTIESIELIQLWLGRMLDALEARHGQ